MGNKLYNETDIQNIANSIRSANGTTTTYKVSEMSGAIDSAVIKSTQNIQIYQVGKLSYQYVFMTTNKTDYNMETFKQFLIDNNYTSTTNYYITPIYLNEASTTSPEYRYYRWYCDTSSSTLYRQLVQNDTTPGSWIEHGTSFGEQFTYILTLN